MRWSNHRGIESSTHRTAVLSGGVIHPTETSLGELRAFVATLERWPDTARVSQMSGAVLNVSFVTKADDMLTAEEARRA